MDVAPFPKNMTIPGTYVMPSMLGVCRKKGIYAELFGMDNHNELPKEKFHGIISYGTFVDGHVKLGIIPDLIKNNLLPCDVFVRTCRNTFWDEKIRVKL